MSTNPVSMRLPLGIEGKAEPEVVETIQYHDDAITDLQEAIPDLKAQIDSLVTTAAAATGSTSTTSGSSQSITNIINNIGFVNPQQGVTAYATLPSDEGALILLGDASPIAVTLSVTGSSPGILLPWYAYFLNLGAGAATLTPASGSISYPGNLGAASMPVVTGTMALVYFDGTNFWASSVVAGITGSGTTGFVPLWTSSSSLGDSHIDDGVSSAGFVTVTEPIINIGGINASYTLSAAEVATLSPFGTVDFGSSVNAFDIGNAGILSAAVDSATPTVAIGAFLGSSTDGTLAGSMVQLYGWDVFNNVEFPITVGAFQQIFVQPIANIDFPTAHGFVGINQNLTPAYPLDVIGDTNVAGNFRINTFTVIPSTATGYHPDRQPRRTTWVPAPPLERSAGAPAGPPCARREP